jgi:hypothetical protein
MSCVFCVAWVLTFPYLPLPYPRLQKYSILGYSVDLKTSYQPTYRNTMKFFDTQHGKILRLSGIFRDTKSLYDQLHM